ncbi:hypothetical protein M5K25_026165 [Dendrobium thyrsiflorum]|uniref:Uncharacterized protein n=1 Tax=Dendrobium thyrsiflorum TaxID=117978 RepID=A0ABD0TWR8_DENTH
MAANAVSTEIIALTEKKMDMALDDIIKMSKKASFKGKQASRTSNKSQRFMNDHGIQRNSKVQRFMNSRSSIRQGVLSQRRTSFKRNQFPVTTAVARRGDVATIRNRVVYPSKQRYFLVFYVNDGKIHAFECASHMWTIRLKSLLKLQFRKKSIMLPVEEIQDLELTGILLQIDFVEEALLDLEQLLLADLSLLLHRCSPHWDHSTLKRFAAASMRRDAGDGNIVRKDKQKPKTLDALFSDLKEQRIRTISLQLARSRGQFVGQGRRGRRQQRGLFGAANAAAGARAGDDFGKFIR